jgi:hypothetical protein
VPDNKETTHAINLLKAPLRELSPVGNALIAPLIKEKNVELITDRSRSGSNFVIKGEEIICGLQASGLEVRDYPKWAEHKAKTEAQTNQGRAK